MFKITIEAVKGFIGRKNVATLKIGWGKRKSRNCCGYSIQQVAFTAIDLPLVAGAPSGGQRDAVQTDHVSE